MLIYFHYELKMEASWVENFAPFFREHNLTFWMYTLPMLEWLQTNDVQLNVQNYHILISYQGDVPTMTLTYTPPAEYRQNINNHWKILTGLQDVINYPPAFEVQPAIPDWSAFFNVLAQLYKNETVRTAVIHQFAERAKVYRSLLLPYFKPETSKSA